MIHFRSIDLFCVSQQYILWNLVLPWSIDAGGLFWLADVDVDGALRMVDGNAIGSISMTGVRTSGMVGIGLSILNRGISEKLQFA